MHDLMHGPQLVFLSFGLAPEESARALLQLLLLLLLLLLLFSMIVYLDLRPFGAVAPATIGL
jgi:hypothetical protein